MEIKWKNLLKKVITINSYLIGDDELKKELERSRE